MSDDEKKDLTFITDLGLTPLAEPEASQVQTPPVEGDTTGFASTGDPLPEVAAQAEFPAANTAFQAPAEPDFAAPNFMEASGTTVTHAGDPHAAAPMPEPAASPIDARPTVVEKIREFSENQPGVTATDTAGLPFHLYIDGPLNDLERARLLDLLARNPMGIREADLEPQFAAGRVLLPRISEYAVVMIVQALRDTAARFRMVLSDGAVDAPLGHAPDEGPSAGASPTGAKRFSAGESVANASFELTGPGANAGSAAHAHPADALPVTSAPALPGDLPHEVIDALTASSTLEARAVETKNSDEFQALVDALQRELKYKAHRRGASAVVGFTVALTRLSLSSSYRVIASGTAVRHAPLPPESLQDVTFQGGSPGGAPPESDIL